MGKKNEFPYRIDGNPSPESIRDAQEEDRRINEAYGEELGRRGIPFEDLIYYCSEGLRRNPDFIRGYEKGRKEWQSQKKGKSAKEPEL